MAIARATTKTRLQRDWGFDLLNYAFFGVFTFLVVYPLYFVVIASISEPLRVVFGEVWIVPKQVTFDGYAKIFGYERIWRAYAMSVFYTVVGTAFDVGLTIPAAYALSRRDLVGRRLFLLAMLLLLFFRGGLIPTYLLVKGIGLENSMWALVFVEAVWIYNIIVCRTFFETTIPDELHEAAVMDGCSDFRFFRSVVVPLSGAVISIMVLFYGVYHWNDFFQAMVYVRNQKLMPLQNVLRDLLLQSQMQGELMFTSITNAQDRERFVDLVRYGVILVASVPMLIIYPFLQRYFVKGIMIGAIKG